jgi:hypothetical protein
MVIKRYRCAACKGVETAGCRLIDKIDGGC